MNTSKVYFSIIVPIYRVELYLEECIESVLRQSFKNFELILVDDGSDDLCPEICDSYHKKDSRVSVIHKQNGGLSDARNYGLEVAKGYYILFLDSDDYWLDDTFLEKIFQRIQKKKADCIIYSRTTVYMDGTPNKIIKKNEGIISAEKGYAENLYALMKSEQCPISAWSKAVKAEIIQKNHLRFIKGILSEDIDWSLWVYSLCASIDVIDMASYAHRVRSNSISQTVNGKHCRDILYMIQTWEERIIRNLNDDENKMLTECIYNFLCYYIFLLLALVEVISKNDREEIRQLVYQKLYLTKKGFSRKNRLGRFCICLFGKRITGKIFRKYMIATKKKV